MLTATQVTLFEETALAEIAAIERLMEQVRESDLPLADQRRRLRSLSSMRSRQRRLLRMARCYQEMIATSSQRAMRGDALGTAAGANDADPPAGAAPQATTA